MSDTRLRSGVAVTLLAVALLLLRYEGDVFFTILAGVLFSIALVHPTTWLSRSLHLGYLGSLALLVAVVLAALGFGAWALGTRLANQLQSLSEELPRAVMKLRHWLVHWTWANRIFGQVLESAPERQVSAGNVVAGRDQRRSERFTNRDRPHRHVLYRRLRRRAARHLYERVRSTLCPRPKGTDRGNAS